MTWSRGAEVSRGAVRDGRFAHALIVFGLERPPAPRFHAMRVHLDASKALDVMGEVGQGDVVMHQPTLQAPLVQIALEHAARQEHLVLLRAIGRFHPSAQDGVFL